MEEVSRPLKAATASTAPKLTAAYTRPFKAPDESLGQLDPEVVAGLMAAAADVALVVDAQGVIRDIAFGSADLAMEGYDDWLGQPWAQTVTVESRPKIEAMLRDASFSAKKAQSAAASSGDTMAPHSRWRQVNHPSTRGADLPMLYSALSLGPEGRVIAFGRDLRATAELQQRLVDAQQAMERDYWRFRQAEARYRLLFELASEAVLIIDTATGRVMDANPAALQLLVGTPSGDTQGKLVGSAFPLGFDKAGTAAIETLLQQVRSTGHSDEVQAKLIGEKVPAEPEVLRIAASLFRQHNATLLVVRLTPFNKASALTATLPSPMSKGAGRDTLALQQQFSQAAPDAMIVTNREGKILWANLAFAQIVHRERVDQVLGDSLDRWLGRTGVDLSVLISNLRQRNVVKLFATTVNADHGLATEVEISAVLLPGVGVAPESFGFTLRDVSRRLPSDSPQPSKELPRSGAQLAELVGRTPLKEIVGETTDLIEKLCIQAALELTRDNRAAAAEMLGLSRQSLYVKLRRFGLGDLDSE